MIKSESLEVVVVESQDITKLQPQQRKKLNVRRMTVIALLSSISIMLSMVPFVGYIQIGPIAITTMYIPVVIGAIIEGPVVGAILGFVFGATSLFRALTIPTVTSFPFINPLVSILPRVMIGIVVYYVYQLAMKITKNIYVSGLITGAVGAMTNTIGVLGMLYVLYGERYAMAMGESASAAKTVILTIAAANGIPEALGGAIVVAAVAAVLKKSKK
ncbi:MAG: ECF transporter S component [Romboutsia sp.]